MNTQIVNLKETATKQNLEFNGVLYEFTSLLSDVAPHDYMSDADQKVFAYRFESQPDEGIVNQIVGSPSGLLIQVLDGYTESVFLGSLIPGTDFPAIVGFDYARPDASAVEKTIENKWYILKEVGSAS